MATGVYDDKEFLFTSGYDGRVLVWELLEKTGPKNGFMDSNAFPQHKTDYSPFPDKKNYAEKHGKEIFALLFVHLEREGDREAGGYIFAAGASGEIYMH
jgi:hypothetical protein